jgi:hypothetical protein
VQSSNSQHGQTTSAEPSVQAEAGRYHILERVIGYLRLLLPAFLDRDEDSEGENDEGEDGDGASDYDYEVVDYDRMLTP